MDPAYAIMRGWRGHSIAFKQYYRLKTPQDSKDQSSVGWSYDLWAQRVPAAPSLRFPTLSGRLQFWHRGLAHFIAMTAVLSGERHPTHKTVPVLLIHAYSKDNHSQLI